MLKAHFKKHTLHFKFDAGTSRGILKQRDVWYLFLEQSQPDKKNIIGIGEAAPIRGLSYEDVDEMDATLKTLCQKINQLQSFDIETDNEFPSIRFALETAIRDLQTNGQRILFNSLFTDGKAGIPINGLVWMGEKKFMFEQIKQKIETGYKCIKIKIGAIDFEEELGLIKYIRQQFTSNEIEIRTDANGAFPPDKALEYLNRLSELQIHSIEQPIKQGQWEEMARLIEKSPVPIALDEELIGIIEKKEELLNTIKPDYIILKPSLLGGFSESEKWINLAAKKNIGWWVTSALESNIGLNAIAQWTYNLPYKNYQGLGTGQLYTNNIASPLYIENAKLNYNPKLKWDIKEP